MALSANYELQRTALKAIRKDKTQLATELAKATSENASPQETYEEGPRRTNIQLANGFCNYTIRTGLRASTGHGASVADRTKWKIGPREFGAFEQFCTTYGPNFCRALWRRIK